MAIDDLVHRLRALTVELDLFGSSFAAQHALHATDVRALIALLDCDRSGVTASPGWLSGHLGLNSASTTALVDRMESRGLVARERDDVDRRKVVLRVTDAAHEMGWAFFGPLIDEVRDVAAGYSSEELGVVSRFLDAVTHAVIVAGGRPSP